MKIQIETHLYKNNKTGEIFKHEIKRKITNTGFTSSANIREQATMYYRVESGELSYIGKSDEI